MRIHTSSACEVNESVVWIARLLLASPQVLTHVSIPGVRRNLGYGVTAHVFATEAMEVVKVFRPGFEDQCEVEKNALANITPALASGGKGDRRLFKLDGTACRLIEFDKSLLPPVQRLVRADDAARPLTTTPVRRHSARQFTDRRFPKSALSSQLLWKF